jgi:hypothetical protein
MNAKQLLRAVDNYRTECEKALEEGDSLPVIEAAIPIDMQKQISKKYADDDGVCILSNVIDGINEKVEALNEAQNDFDCDLDLLGYIANTLAAFEVLEQKLHDATTPEEPDHPRVAEEAPGGPDIDGED